MRKYVQTLSDLSVMLSIYKVLDLKGKYEKATVSFQLHSLHRTNMRTEKNTNVGLLERLFSHGKKVFLEIKILKRHKNAHIKRQ